jgi:hypothetical protein
MRQAERRGPGRPGRLASALAPALVVALALFLAPAGPALADGEAGGEAYGYPITDRWEATVVGTPAELQAELPAASGIPFRKRRLRILPERELPELLAYNRELLYTVALQRQEAAPVLFLIAGTGAAHNSAKNMLMARAFYERGYHVVALSSPTYPNFVAAASTTGVPGHAWHDAEDLYRVMELAWADARGRHRATGYALAGYSLGGFNAAFVAELDSRHGRFGFDKVLLLNPPVNLYNSISLLDRMIENVPGGEDNFPQFFDKVVRVFTDVYRRDADTVGFDERFLAKVYDAYAPRDEELAALVGLAFRLSSSSMIFTADLVTDAGFIKPRGYRIGRYDTLDRFRQAAYRVGFTDYFHEFFYPFYGPRHPELDRDGFIGAMSLRSIAGFLADADHIDVVHNRDDVILAPGEIDFFTEVFGSRARIYPSGGHLGNMAYRENVRYMLERFP